MRLLGSLYRDLRGLAGGTERPTIYRSKRFKENSHKKPGSWVAIEQNSNGESQRSGSGSDGGQ